MINFFCVPFLRFGFWVFLDYMYNELYIQYVKKWMQMNVNNVDALVRTFDVNGAPDMLVLQLHNLGELIPQLNQPGIDKVRALCDRVQKARVPDRCKVTKYAETFFPASPEKSVLSMPQDLLGEYVRWVQEVCDWREAQLSSPEERDWWPAVREKIACLFCVGKEPVLYVADALNRINTSDEIVVSDIDYSLLEAAIGRVKDDASLQNMLTLFLTPPIPYSPVFWCCRAHVSTMGKGAAFAGMGALMVEGMFRFPVNVCISWGCKLGKLLGFYPAQCELIRVRLAIARANHGSMVRKLWECVLL